MNKQFENIPRTSTMTEASPSSVKSRPMIANTKLLGNCNRLLLPKPSGTNTKPSMATHRPNPKVNDTSIRKLRLNRSFGKINGDSILNQSNLSNQNLSRDSGRSGSKKIKIVKGLSLKINRGNGGGSTVREVGEHG